MPRHALPRSLFAKLAKDRTRTGRGRSKAMANLQLLHVFEEVQEDYRRGGKRLSVIAFQRELDITSMEASGISRAKAKRLLDDLTSAERDDLRKRSKTISNRIAAARKLREQLMKQIALSRALRMRG